jgi:hypothetical protein
MPIRSGRSSRQRGNSWQATDVKKTATIVGTVAAFALGGLVGALALLAPKPSEQGGSPTAAGRPAWSETSWPFPMDQWGKGKAFRCAAAECGSEVSLYVRAKIGFCNCTTGVADDEELERLSDFEFLGPDVAPLGAGRSIAVAWMKGRSRAYAVKATGRAAKAGLSVAFNDRCDAIVATVVLPDDKAAAVEPKVIEFLNSRTVLRWAEVTLGL